LPRQHTRELLARELTCFLKNWGSNGKNFANTGANTAKAVNVLHKMSAKSDSDDKSNSVSASEMCEDEYESDQEGTRGNLQEENDRKTCDESSDVDANIVDEDDDDAISQQHDFYSVAYRRMHTLQLVNKKLYGQ
jgi:hypothetical protein